MMRLDKLLSDMGAGTRNRLKKEIRNGHVRRDRKRRGTDRG